MPSLVGSEMCIRDSSLDVVVATVRLDRDQYKTRKDNVTVVMADEVRGADAVDEGKDCRQDGGDQCCICRLDLLKCAQDPATTNVACKAAQAQGLGWQAVRDNYLDYQLDEQMGCFDVYPVSYTHLTLPTICSV